MTMSIIKIGGSTKWLPEVRRTCKASVTPNEAHQPESKWQWMREIQGLCQFRYILLKSTIRNIWRMVTKICMMKWRLLPVLRCALHQLTSLIHPLRMNETARRSHPSAWQALKEHPPMEKILAISNVSQRKHMHV